MTHVRDLLRGMIRIRRFEGKVLRALHPGENPRFSASLRWRRGGGGRRRRRRWNRATGWWLDLPRTRSRACTRHQHGIGALAEMYGKATGCAGGRGGSMHLFDARDQTSTAAMPLSAAVCPWRWGWLLATGCRARPRVTVCFFGEGAVAEGEFHEAMNLAALWSLPVLFRLREQPLRHGQRRGAGAGDTPISAPVPPVTACPPNRRRHGRGRGRGRRPPRGRGDPRPAAVRSFWNAAPTAFGRIRCSTPRNTATRPRLQEWRNARPSSGFKAGFWKTA